MSWEQYEPHERIAVIGCGPAGLLAAWAADRLGYKVAIFSPKRQTVQIGAQYVHTYIPGLVSEAESEPLHYTHAGTAHGYAEKIYGGKLKPTDTSWHKFVGQYPAWPMKVVYRRLWQYFEEAIVDGHVNLFQIEHLARNCHTVFSTMPLRDLLDPQGERSNMFTSEMIYGYPEVMLPRHEEGNFILYNGLPEFRWYRQSRIFGRRWTEWPITVHMDEVAEDVRSSGHQWDPLSLWTAVKPLMCSVDTKLELPPNVRLVGRYGQWRKGVLVHDAYAEVTNYLETCDEMH